MWALAPGHPTLSTLRRLHEFAFVQFHLRAANHQFLHEKRIAQPENGADVVVLGDAVEHDHNWSSWAWKEFVAGSCGAALVRSGQRPTHIPAGRRHMLPAGQYSSANMIVITRSVTDGSDGSGE